ncbi:MAG: phosphoribosylglycinamide formyltransferase [Acidobacteria bacterium]|jgi:phosphoribosylglycinamide formyltransferase-1|nr:phosphoribosylglycinamide formyltransferase [Acidobacteriota bacterium]
MNQGNIAVLLSGRGSNFAAIVRASRRANANFSVRLAISDRFDAPGLRRAERFHIPAQYVDPRAFPDKAAYETQICELLEKERIDLVCLAGYMRLVGPVLLSRFAGRILNIHPALLPSFPGLDAQAQALRHGVKVSGCTVHFVDSGTDTGPIIAQQAVAVHPDDDVDKLSRRILRQEHRLYPRVVHLFCAGRLHIQGRHVIINEE